jgi:hypothetical protein
MENYKAIIKYNNDDFDIVVDFDFAKHIQVGDILIPYSFWEKTTAPWVKEFIGEKYDSENGEENDIFPADEEYRDNVGALELKVFEREFDINQLRIWVELYYDPTCF